MWPWMQGRGVSVNCADTLHGQKSKQNLFGARVNHHQRKSQISSVVSSIAALTLLILLISTWKRLTVLRLIVDPNWVRMRNCSRVFKSFEGTKQVPWCLMRQNHFRQANLWQTPTRPLNKCIRGV